jgi:hypothetical protein
MRTPSSVVSHSDITEVGYVSRAYGETIEEHEEIQTNLRKWNEIVDVLLAWITTARADSSNKARRCIETAIELVKLWRANASVIPSSMGMSDDGEVAFEWVGDDHVLTIETLGDGRAELTHFQNGRVIEEGSLYVPRYQPVGFQGASRL